MVDIRVKKKLIMVTDENIKATISRGKQYSLLLLFRGPNWEIEEAETQRIHWEHLRYTFNLREEGSLLLNGPIPGNATLRAIGIYSVTDAEKIKEMIENDPAVKAGKYRYEIYPWFGIVGDNLK